MPSETKIKGDLLEKLLQRLSNRIILRIIIATAFGLSFVSLVMQVFQAPNLTGEWLISWLQNLSTELFGAIVTFVIIEQIIGGREKQETKIQEGKEKQYQNQVAALSRLKQATTLQAKQAILTEMKELKLFKGMNLSRIDLQDTKIVNTSFQEAIFMFTHLDNATLDFSNCQETWFGGATLKGASLVQTNLQRANFSRVHAANFVKTRVARDADLMKANLTNADLRGANLLNANLEMAILIGAQFDETSILPDGSKYNTSLSPDQLERFTNPKHPEFWRSNDPKSPAYNDNR